MRPHLVCLVGSLGLAIAGPAAAQATRTWVSAAGNDANPCSRAAPCLTFNGAIAKTASGGEIDALDPGGFGPITITKSIVIDGGHALAGVAVSSGDAVTVNAGAADIVVLRRLSLSGNGTSSAGVRFLAGGALHVDACKMAGFAVGLDFRPGSGGRLYVSDLQVGQGSEGGIELESGDAAKPSIATLSQVRLEGTGSYGLRAADNSAASLSGFVVRDATIAGLAALPTLAGDAELNVDGAVLSGNASGVMAQASAPGRAVVRLSKVVALDAAPSVVVGENGEVLSFGNNRLPGGTADFSLAVAPGSVQVKQGATATVTVSVAAVGISPGQVTLACEGLPGGASCAFSPASILPTGSPATSTLSIRTNGAVSIGSLGGPGSAEISWALGLLALVITPVLGRAKGGVRRSIGAAAAALAVLVSCHGGGAKSGGGSQGVAPGNYTMQVIATSAATTHQATLQLQVTAP